MKIVFFRNGETGMTCLRGYHGENTEFGLGNRLSCEHRFVYDAGSAEKETVAWSHDGRAAIEFD